MQQVATQCHLTGGSIVWRARALLNSHYKTIIEYPNACPVNTGSERMQNTTGIANTVKRRMVLRVGVIVVLSLFMVY